MCEKFRLYAECSPAVEPLIDETPDAWDDARPLSRSHHVSHVSPCACRLDEVEAWLHKALASKEAGGRPLAG